MREWNLHSVCEEARCPNIGECWEELTATFMILGDVCTRNCGYCAVTHGRPVWEDREEPERVGRAVARAGARARGHHLGQPRRPRRRRRGPLRGDHPGRSGAHAPGCRVEVLIPDFQGSAGALETRDRGRPRRPEPQHRDGAAALQGRRGTAGRYERTLELFRRARARRRPRPSRSRGSSWAWARSADELLRHHARTSRAADVNILTLGPVPAARRPQHLPVARYYHPDEFAELAERRPRAGLRPRRGRPAGALLLSRQAAGRGRPARRADGRVIMDYVPILMVFAVAAVVAGRAARHPAAASRPRRVYRGQDGALRVRQGPGRAAGGPLRDQVLDHRDLLHPLRHRAAVHLAVGRRCTGSLGWFGFVEMLVFLGILMLGFLYIWREGGLEWE